MSFFKKSPSAQTQSVDLSTVVVHDFTLRHPYASYRPESYRLYGKLTDEQMIPWLDAHLEALLSGAVDDGNGDMLDDLIFSAAREAIPDLERQKASHQDMIGRLAVRGKTDEADYGRLLEQMQAELAQLEDQYQKTLTQIDKVAGCA